MSTAGVETAEPAKPKVPEVPWNTWLALVYAVLVFYAAQLIAGLLVSVYPVLRHWNSHQAGQWLNSSVGAQFVFVLVAEALTVGAVYLFLKKHRSRFSIIGLKRPTWTDPFYGLAAVPLYLLLYVLTVGVISHLVPSLNVNQQQQIGFNDVNGTFQLVLAFISLVVLPPIAEEIMMRGFIYTSLKKAMKIVPAALLTSVIFAAAHLPEGGSAGPLYIAALDTFVLSLVLVYLREKTGSLWASITLHASKNFIAFVVLFLLHGH
ncbi:MAG TPA: type II CAAX endopeptidase family protein [Candidatus Saccharimonadia bacterium]|nr:type II CAAX endopeptidase family protein [Candidatus Saccharimonadia bacterium]